MSTTLSAAEQTTLKQHKAAGTLEVLNCPSDIQRRAAIVASFFTVSDVMVDDPTDTRTRPDPEDKRNVPDAEKRMVPIHFSERRKIAEPRVYAPNGVDLLQFTRELCDTGDRDGRLPAGTNLRWRLFGNAH